MKKQQSVILLALIAAAVAGGMMARMLFAQTTSSFGDNGGLFTPPPDTFTQSSSSSSEENDNDEGETASSSSSGSTSSSSSSSSGPGLTNTVFQPAPVYTPPPSGYVQPTITGETISVTVPSGSAQSVEYYTQNTQTGMQSYLGTAGQPAPSGQWNLDADTVNRLPDGRYTITPRIRMKDGSVVQGSPTALSVETPKEELSLTEKVRFENSDLDTDGDGIPDREEIRIGINPKSADTDKDGFLDADEIRNGFDPNKFSTGDKSDKIAFESPRDLVGKPASEFADRRINDKRFTVDRIERKILGNGQVGTGFSGRALPNSFVTLYIYSDPIIVTVRTDADGNWTYDLDKELPDGDHEIYVAVTDNVGKITAQSEALPFVKTVEAVAIKPAAAATEAKENISPLERSRTEFILMAIIITATFLGIAFIVIGRRAAAVDNH